jgi:CRP/FNR family cyclic AMP-dependent transcriptional regulator
MSHDSTEEQRAEQLCRLDRFESFTDQEIQEIVHAARYLTVPEHWALLIENTPADKAYLILSGEVSVRRQGEEVARLGVGEVIGEMALVNHKLRSATVVAETPLEVLHFTADTVADLQTRIPRLREALTSVTAERSEPGSGA